MKYTILIGVMLALASSVPSVAQPNAEVGSQAPDFSLKDQFGKSWSLSAFSGNITVLVVANPDSGRLMDPWVNGLKNKFANRGVQTVGLLDLHSVPGIGRGIARSRIRKETSDPMILDFSGSIGRAYGVSSKYPVVAVIDKSGVVRAVTRTTYDQQAFAQISRAVDAALAGK